MKKVIVILAITAVFTLGCASTQSATSGAQGAAKKKVIDPEKVEVDPVTGFKKIYLKNGIVLICRKETPTGSNIPREICRWEAQRAAQSLRDQEDTRRIQRNYSVVVR